MVTSSTCSSGTDEQGHNVWNSFLGVSLHRVGSLLEDLLTDEELGRV